MIYHPICSLSELSFFPRIILPASGFRGKNLYGGIARRLFIPDSNRRGHREEFWQITKGGASSNEVGAQGADPAGFCGGAGGDDSRRRRQTAPKPPPAF